MVMPFRFVTIPLVIALFTSLTFAQSLPDKQAQKMKAKLEKIFDDGERAKVELADGRKVQGLVFELGAETFILGEGGRSDKYSYAEVKKVGRFGPSRNAKRWVGLGVIGGLLGLTFWAAATQTR